jgi:hypothetical protein
MNDVNGMQPQSSSKPNLAEHTRTVQRFIEAVTRCTLPHVPQITRQLITSRHWASRFEYGRIIEFQDFAAFITGAPGTGGCNLDPALIEDLLRKSDDLEALAMFRGAMKAQAIDAEQRANQRAPGSHGRGRPLDVYNGESSVHIYKRPSGNSTAAVLRRLEKDRPDIHARVLSGEISGYAGMVEAGFRKRDAIGGGSKPYDKIVNFLSNHIADLDVAEIKRLRDWIDGKLTLVAAPREIGSTIGDDDLQHAIVVPMNTSDLDRLHALAARALQDNSDLNEAAHKLATTLAEDANRPLLVAVVLEFLARRPQECRPMADFNLDGTSDG